MTGLERNADVVQMASYAPLFAHVEGWQWTPDLIWFDNLRSYGTPDYYVQKIFSANKGSAVVPLSLAGAPLEGQNGLFGSATLDNKTQELVLKLVNTTDKPVNPSIRVEGVKKLPGRAYNESIKATALDKTNSLDDPKAVSSGIDVVPISKGNVFSPLLLPYSVNVIRIKIH